MFLLTIIKNLIAFLSTPKDIEKIGGWSNELGILKTPADWVFAVVIPFIIIFVVAFFVGFERQNVGKAAGISSHTLVGVAACALAIMQRLMLLYLVKENKIDGSGGQRIIAQIVAGVSFVGAGVVMKSNKTIRGLTTATTIWCVAIIGIILGSGYLIIGSIAGTFIILFITVRDLSRGINPFKPGAERKLLIKKYHLRKDQENKIIEEEDFKDSDEEEEKKFL